MSTHYLPSKTSWYSTSNKYIFYRFKVVEDIEDDSRSVSVSVQMYKDASSTSNTSGAGTFYLTINNVGYNKTLVYNSDILYADGKVRTYHIATPSISISTASLSVKGYINIPTISLSSSEQGGSISLTPADTKQKIYARYQQPDGSWGEYTVVHSKDYSSGETVSWSSSATNEYKAANISYTATSKAKSSYIDIYRKTYTIKYNSNGGLCPPAEQTYYYGCSDLKLRKNTPTRSGYSFVGWNTASSGTGTIYTSGCAFDSTYATTITLYAVWERNKKQNVYIYNNSKCYASEYIEDDTVSIGNNGEIYLNSFDKIVLCKDNSVRELDFIEGEP